MKRKASAEWQKNLKEGKGTITTESKVLESAQYSFSTRFEDGKGTNPEELIAAAHAGCFSMALSHKLSEAGHTPDSVKTTATVTLDKLEGGFEVTSINLEVAAHVPGVTEAKFNELAEAAKTGCPISKLMNTTITMTAKLEAPAKA
jgi:osmotically inducible protein OsmC